ncbi:hypothetical protein HYH03_009299 [Edaphochlamys debaryana]|uniref:Uncharacterized protein n=1 Tax=Edaphochlamys debaryana TaxID=47281 RepID=A0A835Y1H8_9CHLO|nr:hypothetical protein HYH03_009299 [Edaphochlamys debaryana]|eukprot:KAG2492351.1 hypothetical protein HYH03_009299 [Edaphochlamys debaryana]
MSRKASPAAGDDEAASPRPGSSSSIHAATAIAAAEDGAAPGPGRTSAEGEAVAATLGIELDAVVLEDKPAPRGKGKGR